MSKPTVKPGWLATGARTPASGPKKLAGFAPAEQPPNQYVNELFANISEWVDYLDTFEAEPHTFTGNIVANNVTVNSALTVINTATLTANGIVNVAGFDDFTVGDWDTHFNYFNKTTNVPIRVLASSGLTFATATQDLTCSGVGTFTATIGWHAEPNEELLTRYFYATNTGPGATITTALMRKNATTGAVTNISNNIQSAGTRVKLSTPVTSTVLGQGDTLWMDITVVSVSAGTTVVLDSFHHVAKKL